MNYRQVFATSLWGATWSDFKNCQVNSHIWSRLAYEDIRLRYKRTFFGPFWVTLLTGFHVAGIAFVFGNLFNVDLTVFVPYLAAGFIFWQFLSTILVEGTNVFIEAQGLISSINHPLALYAFRLITRSSILLLHNMVVILVAFLLFKESYSLGAFLVIPGLVLWGIAALFCSILLGIIGTRYRDTTQIVNVIMTLSFLMTPIIWDKKFLSENIWIAEFNPLFHFIEIVRSPLLNGTVSYESWVISSGITIALGVFSLIIYRKYRSKVPYWF